MIDHLPRFTMAFALGVIGSTFVTTEKAAASCTGDRINLLNPVVTVLSGPGDPVAEAALWSTFDYLQLVGPGEFHFDGTIAFLEENP